MYWILAVAGITRLSTWFHPRSLHGDEFWSLEIARLPFLEAMIAIVKDVHGPVYYGLLNRVVWVFGDAEWSLRMISVLASIGTVIFVWLLADKLFGRVSGNLTAFLVAISPYFLQSSNEVRSYSLLACLSVASIYFFITDRRRLYFFVTVALIYTEHLGWFVWLGTMIACMWRRKEWMGEDDAPLAVVPVGYFALGLAIYQAIFGEGILHGYRISEYHDAFILFKKFVGFYWHLLIGYEYSMMTREVINAVLLTPKFFLCGITAGLGFLLYLRGLYVIRKEESKDLFWLFFVITVLPVLILLPLYPIRFDARYMSFLAPFYLILVVHGLSNLYSPWKMVVCGGMIVASMFMGTYHLMTSYTDPPSNITDCTYS